MPILSTQQLFCQAFKNPSKRHNEICICPCKQNADKWHRTKEKKVYDYRHFIRQPVLLFLFFLLVAEADFRLIDVPDTTKVWLVWCDMLNDWEEERGERGGERERGGGLMGLKGAKGLKGIRGLRGCGAHLPGVVCHLLCMRILCRYTRIHYHFIQS